MLMIILCLIVSMLNKGVKRLLECIAYKHVFKERVIECIYVTVYLVLYIFYVNEYTRFTYYVTYVM